MENIFGNSTFELNGNKLFVEFKIEASRNVMDSFFFGKAKYAAL